MLTRILRSLGFVSGSGGGHGIVRPEDGTKFLEVANGDLWLARGDTLIYKSTNKGLSWSPIANRTDDIRGMFYDRTANIIYCVEAKEDSVLDDRKVFYIDLDDSDNVVEMGSWTPPLSVIDASGMDIFKIGSDFYVTDIFEGPAAVTGIQIRKWNDPNWDQVATLVTDIAGQRPTPFLVTVVGTDAYFLQENTSSNNIDLLKFDSTGPTLTSIFATGAYQLDTVETTVIVYDDSDNLTFILNKDADGLNYLQRWNITGASITELGRFDVVFMRDGFNSGVVPNESVKGFGLTDEKIYEIKPKHGSIILRQDASGITDDNWEAISDNIAMNVDGDMFEFTEVSNEIDEIEYDYGIIGIPQVGFFIAHPDFQTNWNKGDSIKIYDQFDVLEFWGIIKDKSRDDRGFYRFDIDSFGNEVYRVQYDNDYSADDLDTKQKDIIDNACDFCYRSSSIVGTTTTFDYKYKRAIAYLFYLGRFLERQIPYIEPDGLIHTEAYDGQTKQAQFYGATYNFKDDDDGAEPSGWVSNNDANCTSTIISDLDGHKKVLKLTDNNGAGKAEITNSYSIQTDATIEIYIAKSDLTNGVGYFETYENVTLITRIYVFEDDILAGVNGAPDTVVKAAAFSATDTLIHIKIVLNSSANTYDIYVDGILEANNHAYFNNSVNGINKTTVRTIDSHTGFSVYYDAIGNSFDPAYTVGDNSVGWELSNHWQNAHFIDIPDIRDIQPGYFEGNTGITRATVRYKDNTLSTKPTIPGSGKT
ncbi:hypothetical protein LCGC14_1832850, partial [marine sediment metagenome]